MTQDHTSLCTDYDFLSRSVTYVYYEQYLTIVNEGLFNIAVCLIPTFVVCCILLGMDLRSGFLNLLTIVMITVDTVGVMTLWGIDFNAVSLINLVTVGGSEKHCHVFASHKTIDGSKDNILILLWVCFSGRWYISGVCVSFNTLICSQYSPHEGGEGKGSHS